MIRPRVACVGKEEDKGGDSDGREKKVSGACGSFTTISVFPERVPGMTWQQETIKIRAAATSTFGATCLKPERSALIDSDFIC